MCVGVGCMCVYVYAYVCINAWGGFTFSFNAKNSLRQYIIMDDYMYIFVYVTSLRQ